MKVGVFFREENYRRGTGASRGLISEARYTAVLGNQEAFKAQMQVALEVENVTSALEVVWLSDGAPENWLLARLLCPRAVQVLDWCHAVQAGVRCGKLILGETSAAVSHWQSRIEALLATEGPDALLAELDACRELAIANEEREALEDLIRYYRTNRERMVYACFKQRGLLIGSGTVENAHRHVIQTRMKKAGQHWSERGGRQMARLRAYRTAGPERFYAAIRWAYRSTRRIKASSPQPRRVDLRRRGLSNR